MARRNIPVFDGRGDVRIPAELREYDLVKELESLVERSKGGPILTVEKRTDRTTRLDVVSRDDGYIGIPAENTYITTTLRFSMMDDGTARYDPTKHLFLLPTPCYAMCTDLETQEWTRQPGRLAFHLIDIIYLFRQTMSETTNRSLHAPSELTDHEICLLSGQDIEDYFRRNGLSYDRAKAALDPKRL